MWSTLGALEASAYLEQLIAEMNWQNIGVNIKKPRANAIRWGVRE